MLSRHARRLTLAGWLGLALGLPAWHGWLTDPGHPWLGWILAAPLLLPLAGLWKGRRYTYAWTSLLVLCYLTYLLTEFVASGEPLAVLAALVSAAALFTGCLLFVRWRARELEYVQGDDAAG